MKTKLIANWQKIFPQVALDLGSSWIRLQVAGKEGMEQEASCLCVQPGSGEVMAFGRTALMVQGKTGETRWLINKGVVQVPSETKQLVNWMIGQYKVLNFLAQPDYLISVPVGATKAEQLANAQVGRLLGARNLLTVAQPLAAAVGARVPLQDTAGSFVVHLGEGRVEAAAIALGTIVAYESSINAGWLLRQKVARHIRQTQKFQVSHPDLEQIISQVVSLDQNSQRQIRLGGQNMVTGQLSQIQVASLDLLSVAHQFGSSVVDSIRTLLSRLSPDMLAEIPTRGLLLTGSLAQLHGLDAYVSNQLQVPVAVVERPDTAVIRGMVRILKHKKEFVSHIASGHSFGTVIDWSE